MDEQTLEIRVSRVVLLIKMAIGVALVMGGLELAFPDKFYDFEPREDRIHVYDALGGAAVLMGLIVALPQIYYLFWPPMMMQVTEEGISFGTGRFYNPVLIGWRHFESVSIGTGPATSAATDQPRGSLEIIFKSNPDVPCDLKTPAGMSYCTYVLSLNHFYMDLPVEAAVAAIKEIAVRNRPETGPDAQ